MEQKQLSVQLRSEADLLGLCDEWHNAWKDNTTMQELINKYIRGLDFCLKHRWPSNRFIVEHFDRGLLRRNNILVNDNRSVLNPKVAVLLGQSTATVRVNGSHLSTIYVLDDSALDLVIHTNELVIVHAFDNAKVRVVVGDGYKCAVVVLNHSHGTVVTAPKSVRYKDDFGYLKD